VLLSDSPPTEPTRRPRNLCIMNPFRDRAPERASERYLTELRSGRAEVLAHLLGPAPRDELVELERKFPIRSWRMGQRKDGPVVSELTYWVQRGNGFGRAGYEEEVPFVAARAETGSRVTGYGAVYN